MTIYQNGANSDSHCFEASLAVTGNIVKFRYPNEEWQQVDGDRYEIEEIQNYDFWYVHCYAECMSSSRGCGSQMHLQSSQRFYGRLISAEMIYQSDSFGEVPKFQIVREVPTKARYTNIYTPVDGILNDNPVDSRVRISDKCESNNWYVKKDSFHNFFAANVLGNPNPKNNNTYTFRVYSQDVKVYEETRSSQPEVELVSCQLESDAELKVDVPPYGYTQISTTEIDENGIQGQSLPENRVNVYLAVPDPPVAEGASTEQANVTDYKTTLAYQFFSTASCSRPSVEYLGSCREESTCPPNTCKVDCGTVFCCYGSDGIAVESIAK